MGCVASAPQVQEDLGQSKIKRKRDSLHINPLPEKFEISEKVVVKPEVVVLGANVNNDSNISAEQPGKIKAAGKCLNSLQLNICRSIPLTQPQSMMLLETSVSCLILIGHVWLCESHCCFFLFCLCVYMRANSLSHCERICVDDPFCIYSHLTQVCQAAGKCPIILPICALAEIARRNNLLLLADAMIHIRLSKAQWAVSSNYRRQCNN